MKTTFTIHAEVDETPVRGNALASGDPSNDRECEDEILARLRDDDRAFADEIDAHEGDGAGARYLAGRS
jgi:hypothetical protein